MEWFVLAVLIGAGFFDLRYRKVPNLISLGLLGTAILYHAVYGQVLSSLAGAVIGMGWFMVPYLMGGMGAGDVKLLGAACAWVAFPVSIYLAIFSSIAGGFLVVLLAFKKADCMISWQALAMGPTAFIRSLWNNGMDHRREKVPYAISIAMGYLAFLLLYQEVLA